MQLDRDKLQQLEVFFDRALGAGRHLLFEHEAYDFLRALGLEAPDYQFAADRAELERAVPNLLKMPGGKLVMKIISPDIMHKLDAGGVDIIEASAPEILTAYDRMLLKVKDRHPEADIQGVIVTEFVPIAYEILMSLIEDEQFGLFVSVGFGGTYTEIFKDFRLALTPAAPAYLREILRSLKSYPIFSGYRGLPSVGEEKILKVLSAMNSIGDFFSEHGRGRYLIEEFEINPFAVTGDGRIVALDSILKFSPRNKVPGSFRANVANIDRFFSARSIAVVGASETPGKIGEAILHNAASASNLNVFPVNPNHKKVMGLQCFPSVVDIPEPVDLAVIAVPARKCPEVVRQCAAKDIKAIVMITGGFRESGAGGEELENEVIAAARVSGARIVGPNCIGVYSSFNSLNTFFLPEERMKIPQTDRNNLVILSQSGGTAINFVNMLQSVGVLAIVSYGNMLDADASDFIAYFNDKEEAEVILVYTEGFRRHGFKFFRTAGQSKKPIILLKGGRSRSSAKAARSHTGSMAGDYARTRAALDQAGVISADTLQEAVDYSKVFSFLAGRRLSGTRVGIVSNAGGLCILATDALQHTNLALGDLSAETQNSLKEIMEGYVQPNNPLDLGGGASDTGFVDAVSILLKDPGLDAVCLLPTIEPTPINQERLFSGLITAIQNTGKPVVVGFAQNPQREEVTRLLEANRIPVYASPERCIRALGAYVSFSARNQTMSFSR